MPNGESEKKDGYDMDDFNILKTIGEYPIYVIFVSANLGWTFNMLPDVLSLTIKILSEWFFLGVRRELEIGRPTRKLRHSLIVTIW